MNKTAIYLLFLAPYVFVVSGVYHDMEDILFMIVLSVLGLICGLNMVNALTSPRRGAGPEAYLFWCMLLKLSFMPIYGICVHLVVNSSVATQSIPIIMFSLLSGLILILTTTSYGWRGLWVAQQRGLVSRRFALGHALIQMCYVLDVPSAVYCYFHIRHLEKEHTLTT